MGKKAPWRTRARGSSWMCYRTRRELSLLAVGRATRRRLNTELPGGAAVSSPKSTPSRTGALFFSVLFGMCLHRFFRMRSGVNRMAHRRLSVMRRLLVVSSLMVLGRLLVMS